MYKRITKPSVLFSMLFASGKKLALTALCSVLIASAALAQDASQEQQPPDQQAQPQAEESPDKPGPSSNFTVTDNEIVFTAPASGYYLRDIRLQNNNGGLRFYGAGVLTEVPNGAAIQFFGNNSQFFPGQLFLDSGASNSAALIFRTAPAGGIITERMRVTPAGNVGIGVTNPAVRLHANGGSGLAIYAESNSGDGLFGESHGSGAGVVALSRNGNGLFGESEASGAGVFGESASGNGVTGRSRGSNGAGILGQNVGGGLAGRFEGNVVVTGTINQSSDRAAKANFAMVDGRAILNRLAGIPIQNWNYKSEANAVRHIGPMAQDFYKAFNVGTDDKHIATVDADGVALAAIQGQYQISLEKDKKIEQLTHRVESLQARYMQLERTVKQQRTAARRQR